MIKDQEQLEYAISQYLDGTLSEFERKVLDDRLTGDAEGRLLLEQYRQIDRALKAVRADVPGVDYDLFSAGLAERLAGATAPAGSTLRLSKAWLGRIAVAAIIVMFVGIGLHLFPHTPASDGTGGVAAVPPPSVFVQGPKVEVAGAKAVVEIAVGPAEGLADRGYAHAIGDGSAVRMTPRIVISAADSPEPLSDDRLY